jgi:hypothetical protein
MQPAHETTAHETTAPETTSEGDRVVLPPEPPTSSSSADLEDKADPPTDRLRGRPLSRIKVFALYFAAAVVVFLIIGAIRTFA